MCIGFIVNIYGRASPTVIMPPLCHVGQVLISAPSSAAFSSHVHSHKTPSQRGKQHVQYEETVVCSTNYVQPKLSYKCTLIIWWLLSQTSWLRVRMVCKAILLCRSNLPALPFFVCVCADVDRHRMALRAYCSLPNPFYIFFIAVSLFYHSVK